MSYFYLSNAGRIAVLAVVLLGICVTTLPRYANGIEKTGDRIQIALPLMALGCAMVGSHGKEFGQRFTLLMVAIHGPKNALDQSHINMRPNGKPKGFPSGHSAAAAFGAAALAFQCIPNSKLAMAVVASAAGFVGYSRVQAEEHFWFQVLAGWALGITMDRAARSMPVRRRFLRINMRSFIPLSSGRYIIAWLVLPFFSLWLALFRQERKVLAVFFKPLSGR